ncbi:MAG: helix-turn-helix transcriptional regulator, partial [Victivallales bacterium]|nr:helix-turn-helix transcriptional regulator [Victivallales bacterium]
FNDLFFQGASPMFNAKRQSHRKTHPDQCGKAQRSYCIRHCMDELNQRIANSPEEDILEVHCRYHCFELAAPVFREGRCVLVLFAGLLDRQEHNKNRLIARLLPVFAAGLETKVRTMLSLKNGSRDAIIERVEEFIQDHYAEPISTAAAAKKLCISVSRLCHILQAAGRGRFSEMLMAERIQHAKHLLEFSDSDLQITEIAHLCGFPVYEHFTRSFKRIAGKSPSEWRKMCMATGHAH